MADRKYSPKSSFNKEPLETVIEEIVDEETKEVSKMATPKLKRSRCYNRLSMFLLPSPEKSPSPTKSEAKLPQEYSQPPRVPAKLARHDARPAPDRAPPPPPPSEQQQQPRSPSMPRPEDASTKLRKPDSPSRLQPRTGNRSPVESQRRERSSSLAPPMEPNGGQSHVVSSPTTIRPTSYQSDQEANRSGRLNKRKSWLGGLTRSRNTSQDLDLADLPNAWVEIQGQKLDYNLSYLINGEVVRGGGRETLHCMLTSA